MADSFFTTLKLELLDGQHFRGHAEAKTPVFDLMETWCSPHRPYFP